MFKTGSQPSDIQLSVREQVPPQQAGYVQPQGDLQTIFRKPSEAHFPKPFF